MFKTTSRFDALMENTPASKTQSYYSRSRPTERYSRHQQDFSFTSSSQPFLKKKEVVPEMSFPELETTKFMKDQKSVNAKNFAQVVKTQPQICNKMIDVLPDGWIRITRDPEMENININYGNYSKKNEKNLEEDTEERNKPDILNLMNTLSNLHYTRTQEYIRMWGIDEWEQQFTFKTNSDLSSGTDSENENDDM